jgi:SAM-dependent methyltransferase
MKDLFGKAILDYATGNNPEDIITETSISEADEMSVAYLFRSFDEMPEIEQKALSLVKGKILDIGCGAGSHSLYLTDRDLDVTSIDISPHAVEACRKRGVKNVRVQDMMSVENEKFDTILMLMNGTGIFGKLENTAQYLQKLKSILAVDGQTLIDSSDIIYMFDDDDDGGKWIPGDDYYGELTFYLTNKGQQETPFDWLYLDYNTLQNAALANGLRCEMILEGSHYDYLARLTHLP